MLCTERNYYMQYQAKGNVKEIKLSTEILGIKCFVHIKKIFLKQLVL